MELGEILKMDEFGYVILAMARKVVKGELGLHDDRKLLVPQEKLLEILNQISSRNIQDLLDNGLLLPIEEDESDIPLFHALNCLEFLGFLNKMENAGFPLSLQQAVAEEYHSLVWSLYDDIDHEISQFRQEYGREPSQLEIAFLRVLNEIAVANVIAETQEEILGIRPEYDGVKRLQERIEKAANRKQALTKTANFPYGETQIEVMIKEVWKPPLQYFHQREIKAFIDLKSIRWTKDEFNLLWTGHFDFALCDEKGVLCLVIEYQGGGHFGLDENKVKKRDMVKNKICEKAGIPLIALGPEYQYIAGHRQVLQGFLNAFAKNIKAPELVSKLSKLLREYLDLISSRVDRVAEIDSKVANIRYRLEIYELQGKAGNIFGLLWDMHELMSPFSPLPRILRELD